MGSEVYSEVVELIARVDRFDRAIQNSYDLLSKTIDLTDRPIDTAKLASKIDDLIAKEKLYREQVELTNKVIAERRLKDTDATLGYDSTAVNAHNAAQVAAIHAAQRAADLAAEQKRAAINKEIEVDEYALLKAKLANEEKIAIMRKWQTEQEMLALTKRLADEAKIAEKAAAQERDNARNVALAKQAQYERDLATTAKKKADEEALIAKEKSLLNDRLATEEKVATLRKWENDQEMLALTKRLADEEKIAIMRKWQTEQEMLALTKRLAVQSTASYNVGNTVLNGKVGAGFDIAAGAAFATGANSIGGTIYMAERAAYALGLGQKSLGAFAEKLGWVQREGEGAEESIAKFGSRVIALGSAAAAAALPLGAMFAGRKLDTAVAEMSTLLADASVSGHEFAGMMNSAADSANRLSIAFNTDIVDVVHGFKTALSTGIDASQLEEFGRTALTVSKGLGTSFEDSVSILTTFKDAYKADVTELSHYSDVLFNAINVGKFQVDDLRANIGRVATAASEAGVGVEDMMSALATLTRVGLSTSQSITSLNRLIGDIVNPTDKAQKAFDRFGLATGSAALKTKTLLEYLDDVKSKTGGSIDALGELFTNEQARRGAVGLTTNTGLATSIRADIGTVGTAMVAANRAMDTFGENMGKVWNILSNVVQLIGRDLLQQAKNVFFPGGPMGADTLDGLRIALEEVGIVIKLIGTILIAVGGVAFNVLKTIVDSVRIIAKIAQGEFAEAFEIGGNSIRNLADSMGNAIVSFETMLTTSFDRMKAGTTDVTKTSVDNIGAVKTEVIGMSDIFSNLGTATKKINKEVTNTYDEMREAIAKTKLEAIELMFVQQYKPQPYSGIRAMAGGEQTVLALQKQMVKIKQLYSEMNTTAGRSMIDSMYNTTEDKVDAQIKEYDAILKASREERLKISVEDETAIAKAREDARVEFYKKHGVTLPKVNADAPSKTAPDTALELTGQADRLFELYSTYTQLGALSEKTTAEEVTQRYQILSAIGEQLNMMEGVLELSYRQGDVDQATYESQIALIASHRKKLFEDADALDKKKMALHDDEIKRTAERYRKEYEAAEAAWQAKKKLYDKEEDRINNIIKKQTALIATLQQDSADRRISSRDNPDYARRQYKQQVESGIETVSRIGDPEEQTRKIEELRKIIDKFVNAAKEAGGGARAEREAAEYAERLAKIEAVARERAIQAAVSNGNARDIATARKNKEEADNPIAVKTRAEAMQVVKDTLKAAAGNGINLNGDYKMAIEKVAVSVEGLDRATVIRLVEAKVKEGLADYVRDQQRGRPTPGSDSATGADDTF